MPKLPDRPYSCLTVKKLAQLLNCPYEGEGQTEITGVASLDRAQKGELVFLAQAKNLSLLEQSQASAAIIPSDLTYSKIAVIKSDQPYLSFIRAVKLFFKPYRLPPGIHPQAVVDPSAKIGKDVAIGAFSFIGEGVKIGAGTIIFPLVSIYPQVTIGQKTVIHSQVSIREGVRIGNKVIIHNGATIGADGFGYQPDKQGSHIKIPQIGTVVIEDEVEIGANTTIDRAALGETVIKKGAKIDNLVQVAHNVTIGRNTILAAQTGIAGSTQVGNDVLMGGQVGVTDHVSIGNKVIAAAKTGITKSIPPKAIVSGSPHLDIRDWRKVWVLLPHLYDLVKDVKKLKKRIEDLEKKL